MALCEFGAHRGDRGVLESTIEGWGALLEPRFTVRCWDKMWNILEVGGTMGHWRLCSRLDGTMGSWGTLWGFRGTLVHSGRLGGIMEVGRHCWMLRDLKLTGSPIGERPRPAVDHSRWLRTTALEAFSDACSI